MRIIDTHTHLPGSLFGPGPRSIDDLYKEFIESGLSGAWIFTTDGLIKEANRNNDILANSVKDKLDFFTPFCTVDPLDGERNAIEELIRSKEKLGMRGVKLHPWLQRFSITHTAVLPILKKAGELQMPVLFHDGTPPYSTPLQIASAAEQAPKTTVILGHSGLNDLYQDAIHACLRHENIYLCLCSLSGGWIRNIIDKCPTDKLLFGSDGGFDVGDIQDAINKVRVACSEENTLIKIFYDNPRKIIN